MYEYISPNNRHLDELKQYGESLIIDIILMLHEEYNKHIRIIEHGIENNNYEEIQRGVHTIKANLRYFIEIQHPLIIFYQDFENRARDKWIEQKSNGYVEKEVDFSPELQKLKDLSREPIEEIMRFKADLEQSGK
jgi:hypothetical protein